MNDTSFVDAERLFDSIMSRYEDHLNSVSPGAGGLQYHFYFMGQLREHRRIIVKFRTAHGQDDTGIIFMPGAHGYWSGKMDPHHLRLELTGQEYDTFLDLVWLGGCLNLWPVEGLMTVKGESSYITRGLGGLKHAGVSGVPIMLDERPTISPLAILAAFAGGEFEAEWPHRKKHIENAWYLWQSRHAEQSNWYEALIAQQGGGRGAEIWKSDEGPDYL